MPGSLLLKARHCWLHWAAAPHRPPQGALAAACPSHAGPHCQPTDLLQTALEQQQQQVVLTLVVVVAAMQEPPAATAAVAVPGAGAAQGAGEAAGAEAAGTTSN